MRNDRLERIVLKALNRRHTCAGSFYWRIPDEVTLPTFRLRLEHPELVKNFSGTEVGAIRLDIGGWRVYVYGDWTTTLGLCQESAVLAHHVPTYSAAARVLTSLCIVRGLT